MKELINQIIKWGRLRGINNPDNQFIKLAEEILEAKEAQSNYKLNIDHHEDCLQNYIHMCQELGDIGVVWILLCNMYGVEVEYALQLAHEKNKNRKGKTINGNFIKEEDLNG